MARYVQSAKRYINASRSENTRRSYRAGWVIFEAWCKERGLTALPADGETVALYMTHMADSSYKPATIDARMAAISAAHRDAGHFSPTKAEIVHLVRRGVRNTLSTAQRQVLPISVENLRVMVAGLSDGVAGRRDRALLLIGFAGALRRSELVGLDIDDVIEVPNGLTITLRRSKTDQEGRGHTIGLPFGANPELARSLPGGHGWRSPASVRGRHSAPWTATRTSEMHGSATRPLPSS